jgi:site-specific DNA recombinase
MGSKPPFGYVKSPEDKHLLVIDPPAAEIVKRLFREFASGESGRNMATQLNAEGVDTPAEYYFKQTGKRATRSNTLQQWGSCTILQLLRTCQGDGSLDTSASSEAQNMAPMTGNA